MTNLSFENVRIGFKNFRGEKSKFNREGSRNFVIFLDEPIAQELHEQGWAIKFPKVKEDIDIDQLQPQPYLPVSVTFDPFPPKIVLINGDIKTMITEETVNTLDFAEIINVDLIIRPYEWEVNGKTGIKAYLKTMYVTVNPDPFTLKYGF